MGASVAAGEQRTVWVRPSDGALFLWGLLNPTTNAARVPTPIQGMSKVAVREVAAGKDHALILGGCGGVWSCGLGYQGRLGHGDEAHTATPKRIEGLKDKKAVQVSAGSCHSLVLTGEGHVYSFGHGGVGALGLGDKANQKKPEHVAAFLGILIGKRVTQVSAGYNHSLAVSEEGELFAWGAGVAGQLGLSDEKASNELTPKKVPLPGVRIRMASAGGSHSLAVTTDGALFSFGEGAHGQLGHGDKTNHRLPTRVEALAGTPVRSVSAGGGHSVALTEAGAVLTFGQNNMGQLGLGAEFDATASVLVPTAVAALAGKDVAEVSAGDRHTAVLLAGEELLSFGSNKASQLGTGEVPGGRSSLPVRPGPPAPALVEGIQINRI